MASRHFLTDSMLSKSVTRSLLGNFGAAEAAPSCPPRSVRSGSSRSASSAPTPAPVPHSASSRTGPLGPAARLNLTRFGVSPQQIPASGPKGILIKYDVIQYAQSNKIDPVNPGSAGSSQVGGTLGATLEKYENKEAAFRDIELTTMRKTIAKRLYQSKSSIPHSYITIPCSMSQVTTLRNKLKSLDIKVSVNDFLVKCVGNALAKCPPLNAIWEDDELKNTGKVDISVAVATKTGLITPIVTNVMDRDVISISKNIKELADKAKAGKLQPNEFMGGTFTISNLGMFGVHRFTANFNPPQCAILAIGGSYLVLGEDGQLKDNADFTLSYDARAIMPEEAAKFLATLRHEVESLNEMSMNLFSLQSQGD